MRHDTTAPANTYSVVGFGDFSDASTRVAVLASVMTHAAIECTTFNRFFADGRRIRRPQALDELSNFSLIDFAHVPHGVSGTVSGQTNGLLMLRNCISLTLEGRHPASDIIQSENVLSHPAFVYGFGFHLPSAFHPSLFAAGMPFTSAEWSKHLYFEKPSKTIAWSKTAEDIDAIRCGAMRHIFEFNLLNPDQVKQVNSGHCGTALRRHGLAVSRCGSRSSLSILKVPLEKLEDVRVAFAADQEIA